jgi:hypothetical protein
MFANYADWIVPIIVVSPMLYLSYRKWRESREESAIAEQWAKFNEFVEWRERMQGKAREGFATFGMLLLTAGLSLPVVVMVFCLRGGFGIWSLSGAVAAATFASAFCVVTGNKLSKAKVQ